MVFFIFTTNYWIVFIPISFLSFGTGISRPILTSKLRKVGKREEVGSLLGANNAFHSIGQIITPILGGLIFQYLPPQILPLLSAIIFSSIFILWRCAFVKPFQKEKSQIIKSEEQIISKK